jgi:UDP-N-acetylglucosamine acyltransferase
MSQVHIAHDCIIGDEVEVLSVCRMLMYVKVIVSSLSGLAGHVHVDKHAYISGTCGICQRVKIGKYSFLAAGSTIDKDLIPFGFAMGNRASLRVLHHLYFITTLLVLSVISTRVF